MMAKTLKINILEKVCQRTGWGVGQGAAGLAVLDRSGNQKSPQMALDFGEKGSNMKLSPPIQFRIEWADSQGNVTASWLPAHFRFLGVSGRRTNASCV
jgi:hypothetical protein